MPNVRNNDWINDDKKLAESFFGRLRPFIPETVRNLPVSGLNERLRFLRYDPGQYFAPHEDGQFRRDDGSETSFVTVQIYLNDEGLFGGETKFIGRDRDVKVYPRTGRVLLFQHDMLHEGSRVSSGRKYVIRTDVMYSSGAKPME